MPWDNLNQIRIVFSDDVNVAEGSLVVTGLSGTPLAFSGFTYDRTTHTAIWTLASPLGADRIKVDLAATGLNAVTDLAGNVLDGDWNSGASSYPSGDGSEGGDFVFAFNVLPADVNGDGIVNSQDIALTSSDWLKSAQAADLNADGIVNVQDLALLTANWLTTIPVNGGALASVAGFASASVMQSNAGRQTTSIPDNVAADALVVAHAIDVQPRDDDRRNTSSAAL